MRSYWLFDTLSIVPGKNILFFLILVFILFSVQNANSSNAPPTLRLHYIPPQDSFDESFDKKKYLTELFKIYAKYMPMNIDFVASPVENFAQLASRSTGGVDILTLSVKTPQRMFHLKFSKLPVTKTKIYIAADTKKKLFYGDKQALQGKTIAMYSKSTDAKKLLDTYLKKNNIRMNYKIHTIYDEFVKSEADFYLTNSLYFINGKQIVDTIGEESLYFATTPKHNAVLQQLDAAMEKANNNDILALERLNREYVDKALKFLSRKHGKDAIQNLEKPKKITLAGYFDKHYPVQYVTEQGESKGIIINILKLLEQIHYNPYDLYPYTPNSGINIADFDMIFSIIGDRQLKEKHFYSSKPYANLPMVLFQNENSQEVYPQRIAMMDYSTLDHEKVQASFPNSELKIFTTFESIFAAYTNNEVHAILMSSAEAEYVIAELGMLGNYVASVNLTLPLQFYLSQKYPAKALDVLNSFIDELNPVLVNQAIIEAENEIRAPITMYEYYLKHRVWFFLACALGVLFLIALYVLKIYSQHSALRKVINTDTLTGLSSKVHACATLEHLLQNAVPDEYMIITLDIDKFSLLNQVYGREKADEVLCHIATEMTEQYTAKNKPYCIARLRDDVFMLILKTEYYKDNYVLPECQINTLYGVKEILKSDYNISLSIGAYVIDDVTLPVETIIDYCHAARYKGKSMHGIVSTMFTPEMKTEIDSQKRIIYCMEQALENEEFALYFQPKVIMTDGDICGAEVLVRWVPTNGPVIYPDSFISIFEQNAFIANLDMYVFEKTCQFISEHRELLNIPPLAVNLSGFSVLHDDTLRNVQRLMREYAIQPDELEIEITESAFVFESDTFSESIEGIRELGFKITIDDFGTGVSSLHRLSSLQVDVVKLDKAFLDHKLTQRKGIILVASLIGMLHRLNIKVVAEGVETQGHVNILQKMHCDIAQGYFYYKPLAQNDFVHCLRQKQFVPQLAEARKNITHTEQ